MVIVGLNNHQNQMSMWAVCESADDSLWLSSRIWQLSHGCDSISACSRPALLRWCVACFMQERSSSRKYEACASNMEDAYACHVSRLRCVSKLTCDSKEWICIQDWIAQIADLSSYQNCCLQTCIHSLIHLFVQYVWILPHNWVHTGLLPADEQILCANGMKSKSKP